MSLGSKHQNPFPNEEVASKSLFSWGTPPISALFVKSKGENLQINSTTPTRENSVSPSGKTRKSRAGKKSKQNYNPNYISRRRNCRFPARIRGIPGSSYPDEKIKKDRRPNRGRLLLAM